jgi:hypothetical protein
MPGYKVEWQGFESGLGRVELYVDVRHAITFLGLLLSTFELDLLHLASAHDGGLLTFQALFNQQYLPRENCHLL